MTTRQRNALVIVESSVVLTRSGIELASTQAEIVKYQNFKQDKTKKFSHATHLFATSFLQFSTHKCVDIELIPLVMVLLNHLLF